MASVTGCEENGCEKNIKTIVHKNGHAKLKKFRVIKKLIEKFTKHSRTNFGIQEFFLKFRNNLKLHITFENAQTVNKLTVT